MLYVLQNYWTGQRKLPRCVFPACGLCEFEMGTSRSLWHCWIQRGLNNAWKSEENYTLIEKEPCPVFSFFQWHVILESGHLNADWRSLLFLPLLNASKTQLIGGISVQVHPLICNLPASDKMLSGIQAATGQDRRLTVLKQVICASEPDIKRKYSPCGADYWYCRDKITRTV